MVCDHRGLSESGNPGETTRSHMVYVIPCRNSRREIVVLWQKGSPRSRPGNPLPQNFDAVMAEVQMGPWSLAVEHIHILSLPIETLEQGKGILPQPRIRRGRVYYGHFHLSALNLGSWVICRNHTIPGREMTALYSICHIYPIQLRHHHVPVPQSHIPYRDTSDPVN